MNPYSNHRKQISRERGEKNSRLERTYSANIFLDVLAEHVTGAQRSHIHSGGKATINSVLVGTLLVDWKQAEILSD